jgi:GNAT superfamily N-acetyltransferase
MHAAKTCIMNNPANFRIKNLQEYEIPLANRILQAAFGKSEDRQAELRRILSLQPDGFFIAYLVAEAIGTVCAVDYGNFAYIGMMAVLPEVQGRGYGRALMESALAWLEQRESQSALLDASPKGEQLYRNLGFVAVDRARLFKRAGVGSTLASPLKVELLDESHIPELVEFDLPIFGADRGKVFHVYLADFPRRAFVSRDELGNINGYLFALDHRIGPWVASSPDVATELLSKALLLSYDGDISVISPGVNSKARNLLLSAGFQFQRDQTHMQRATIKPVAQRYMIYGQTSFALG